MIGSTVVVGRELQQLPSRAGETTLAGQLAEPLRHLSIMCAVKKQVAAA